MSNPYVFLFSVFFLLSSEFVFAYDEPDNFAGLKFGEDLTRQIKACVNDTNRYPDWNVWDHAGTRCYQKQGESFRLWNMGMPDGVYRIRAQQLSGKFAAVELLFVSSAAATILATFKQRYGIPTKQSAEPWISRGGVKVTSLTASWTGKTVSILFQERAAQIDEGRITYQTKTWAEHMQAEAADKIKKEARGL